MGCGAGEWRREARQLLLLLLLLLPLLLLLLLQQGALGVAQDNSGPFFGFIGFSGGECAAMKRRRSIIKCIKRRKETKGDRQRQIYNAKEKRQEEADKSIKIKQRRQTAQIKERRQEGADR